MVYVAPKEVTARPDMNVAVLLDVIKIVSVFLTAMNVPIHPAQVRIDLIQSAARNMVHVVTQIQMEDLGVLITYQMKSV
tara:strand:- start:934 stop:1170 length:237 start_codon:yes stop_codon:yes gene_type:complete